MENIHKLTKNNAPDGTLEILDFIKIVWDGKYIIAIITVFISILSLFYSLSLPDIYKSTVLISPQDSDSISNSYSRSIGRVSSLTGISVPTPSIVNKSDEGIAKLKSYSFYVNNISNKINLEDLHAVKHWNRQSNTLSYDNDIYDVKVKSWGQKYGFHRPSDQKSYAKFNKLLSIVENQETGFIKVSIEHQSPYIAKLWLDLIIFELNIFFRITAKNEAENSIKYLNKKIYETNSPEVKQALSELIKSETQKLLLVEAREEYIFKIIDPPIAPEIKDRPRRAFILILGIFLGLILGILIVMLKNFFNIKLPTNILDKKYKT